MSNSTAGHWIAAKPIPLVVILAIATLVWQFSPPEGLTVPAYHTAIIFIATIAGIIANVMPTGALAIISLAFFIVLRAGGAATPKEAVTDGMTHFNNPLIWLIIIAFTIARAFIKTGLGRRIALLLLSKFGQSTLRVAYCLGVADFLIAPATPSNTARSAIVSPIANSLAKTIKADDRKLGQFLISSSAAINDASAVGFQTGFSGNLALIGIASSVAGIHLDFAHWAAYLLVPALFILVVLPFLLYKVIKPETRETPEATQFAKTELASMGKMSVMEWKLVCVFIGLIIGWVGGSSLGLYSTSAAFIGLSAILLLGVLNWDDIKSEKGAWDTLVWFAVLMGMANNLKRLGFTDWVGHQISGFLSATLGSASPLIFLLAMMVFYLFLAYFFASATAKVVAIAPVFIGALISLHVSPMLAVLSIAGISSLGCNLATYSHARNPLLIGYGYHTDGEWMRIGLVIAISSGVLFMVTGLTWWNIIGII
ncbi:MAG: DASS family sodium-coupled anion symporter [Vibrio sp.]